jgi:hypothetical protein
MRRELEKEHRLPTYTLKSVVSRAETLAFALKPRLGGECSMIESSSLCRHSSISVLLSRGSFPEKKLGISLSGLRLR